MLQEKLKLLLALLGLIGLAITGLPQLASLAYRAPSLGTAADPNRGGLFVLDEANDRIFEYDSDPESHVTPPGSFVRTFGEGELSVAVDIEIHPLTGNIFVSEVGNGADVREFDRATGKLVGSFGQTAAVLRLPRGMVFLRADLLVADVFGDAGLMRFDGTSGIFIGPFGESVENLEVPRVVKVSPAGDIYVLDCPTGGCRIKRFAGLGGEFLGELVPPGVLFGPMDMAFSRDGTLLVTDSLQDNVQAFDPLTGELLDTVGGFGLFEGPDGIAVLPIEEGIGVQQEAACREIWHVGHCGPDQGCSARTQVRVLCVQNGPPYEGEIRVEADANEGPTPRDFAKIDNDRFDTDTPDVSYVSRWVGGDQSTTELSVSNAYNISSILDVTAFRNDGEVRKFLSLPLLGFGQANTSIGAELTEVEAGYLKVSISKSWAQWLARLRLVLGGIPRTEVNLTASQACDMRDNNVVINTSEGSAFAGVNLSGFLATCDATARAGLTGEVLGQFRFEIQPGQGTQFFFAEKLPQIATREAAILMTCTAPDLAFNLQMLMAALNQNAAGDLSLNQAACFGKQPPQKSNRRFEFGSRDKVKPKE